MDWVFTPAIGDEIVNMTQEGEGSCIIYSYFPYQADFGLVERSAYSSVANPNFFHWVHILGALLGHRRSQLAKFTFEGCLSDIGLNAAVMAWVFDIGTELAPQFSATGIDYGKEIILETEDSSLTHLDEQVWTEMTGRLPRSWYTVLKTNGYKLPNIVQKRLDSMQKRIQDPREGTIGQYVKNQHATMQKDI